VGDTGEGNFVFCKSTVDPEAVKKVAKERGGIADR
jgi:hypothetical protein